MDPKYIAYTIRELRRAADEIENNPNTLYAFLSRVDRKGCNTLEVEFKTLAKACASCKGEESVEGGALCEACHGTGREPYTCST